ncbi:MAG: transporter, family, glucarate transporter [Gammaproteobacteria bacterium]|nr:transporter, family, glucarate transporter [Gammaproteobacteria bacterium]
MSATAARYRVTAFAISLAALAYVQRVAISQAAEGIQVDLGLGKAELGLVFGAFGLSYALFEIPNGLLGDRLGVRVTLTRIVIAWSVFTALTGAAWNFTSLWIARFLFGAGEAGCFPNLTRMLSTWLPLRSRLRAQALMWACTRWAGAATPLLVLALVRWQGWRWAFVVLAVLGFVWAAAFYLWFRDDPAEHPAVNAEELSLLQDARALTTQEGEPQWYRSLLKLPVMILVFQYFCFSFVWYFYVTWLPSYLREARHASATEAAAFAMLPLLFGGFGSLVAGYAAARFSRRKIAFFGFLFSGLLLFAVTRISSTSLAMVAMGLASFCSDLTMPISWNACVEIGRRHTATLSGAMNMFGNFAGFVAPVVSGAILARSAGDWNLLIYLMVAASFIAATCWMFLDPGNPEAHARTLMTIEESS